MLIEELEEQLRQEMQREAMRFGPQRGGQAQMGLSQVPMNLGGGIGSLLKPFLGHLEKRASSGSVWAHNMLGLMYEEMCDDCDKALEHYKLAADQGDAYGQFQYAFTLEDMDVQGLSEQKAIVLYYQKAADQGLADAEFCLGNIYYDGRLNVSPDREKAIQLYRSAAQKGLKDAKDMLNTLRVPLVVEPPRPMLVHYAAKDAPEKPVLPDMRGFLEKYGFDRFNLEQENNHGVTPLTVAIEKDQADMVQALLKAGADAAQVNRHGNTPLSLAKAGKARHGNSGILLAIETSLQDAVWPFIENNGFSMQNFNAPNIHKSTALTVAVSEGKTKVAQALIQLGANPAQENGHGNTPLSLAEKRLKQTGQRDMLDIIEPAIKAPGKVRPKI